MNEKLFIQQIVDTLAETLGMERQDVENFAKEFFHTIEKGIENDKYVKIKGFGTFKLIEVDARESVNVNTGERFEIQGHSKVSFTPDNSLKELINKPFSQFETVVLNENTVLDGTTVLEEEEVPQETEAVIEEEVPQETEAVIEKVMAQEENVVEEDEERLPEEETTSEEETTLEEETTAEEEASIEEETTPEAETPQEPVPPVMETLPLTPEEKEQRTTMKYFVGIVVFVVILCGIGIAFMYYPTLYDYILPKSPAGKEAPQTPKSDLPTDSTTIATDSIAAQTDSIVPPTNNTAPKTNNTDPKTDNIVPPQPVAVLPAAPQPRPGAKPLRAPEVMTEAQMNAPYRADSTSYIITGTRATHKIGTGETLTRIALKYYGTKAPWPYIVKHNPIAIKNANNVPIGTVINIPELVAK
jgi:nucleoid DNA-binding protein